MFLRKTSRFKDGKVHDYWSVAENSRAGRRVVRIARGEAEPPKAVARGVRQLLYLGEIDEDRQNAWLNAIGELDERKEADERDCLIPPPPPEPPRETRNPVRTGCPSPTRSCPATRRTRARRCSSSTGYIFLFTKIDKFSCQRAISEARARTGMVIHKVNAFGNCRQTL